MNEFNLCFISVGNRKMAQVIIYVCQLKNHFTEAESIKRYYIMQFFTYSLLLLKVHWHHTITWYAKVHMLQKLNKN